MQGIAYKKKKKDKAKNEAKEGCCSESKVAKFYLFGFSGLKFSASYSALPLLH